jgi:hypothetical protein
LFVKANPIYSNNIIPFYITEEEKIIGASGDNNNNTIMVSVRRRKLCPLCKGKGKIPDDNVVNKTQKSKKCDLCLGSGSINKKDILPLYIPEGFIIYIIIYDCLVFIIIF